MNPDDWHEIALHWDWNAGIAELEWITGQRNCDRATAFSVLCSGSPGDVATGRLHRNEVDHSGFVRDLAARLEGGFYSNAEFDLGLSMRQRAGFADELSTARDTRASPWQLPEELLDHAGRRHKPKYAVTGGRAHFAYEYWLEHMAPRHQR